MRDGPAWSQQDLCHDHGTSRLPHTILSMKYNNIRYLELTRQRPNLPTRRRILGSRTSRVVRPPRRHRVGARRAIYTRVVVVVVALALVSYFMPKTRGICRRKDRRMGLSLRLWSRRIMIFLEKETGFKYGRTVRLRRGCDESHVCNRIFNQRTNECLC